MLLWLSILACSGGGADPVDTDTVVHDDTGTGDDTGGDDTGEIQGDIQLLLSAPAVLRLDLDGQASASVGCQVWVDGERTDDTPTLAVSGNGSLSGGVLSVDDSGESTLSCAFGGAEVSGSVITSGAWMDSSWSEVAETYRSSLDAMSQLSEAEAVGDEIWNAALETLRADVARLEAQSTYQDPVVWNVPGGYPSAATLSAEGYDASPDDAAALEQLAQVNDALDAYVAAMEGLDLDAEGDEALIPIDEALDGLEAAMANADSLDVSVPGGLAMRVAMSEHLNQHLLPAMLVGPKRIVEATNPGVAPPPFALTSMLGLSATLGIRGKLIETWYGPAIDWIAGAVDTLAKVALIDAAWAPSETGPEIWSVNFGGYAIFEGSELTINGEGFSDQADLNQILFVQQGFVTEALGIFDACKAAWEASSGASVDYFDAVDKMDGCVDTLVGSLTDDPKANMGTGAMGDGQEYLGVYGDQYFSVGVPPVTYSGSWVDLVVMIPVNLESGERGESHGVLLYP